MKLLISLLILITLIVCVDCSQNLVSTELRSNWPRASIATEATEFLYAKSEENFWGLIQHLSTIGDFSIKSEEAQLAVVLDYVKKNVNDDFLYDSLIWSLSIHEYSSVVEAHRQLSLLALENKSKECTNAKNFLSFGNKIICDLESLIGLKNIIEKQQEKSTNEEKQKEEKTDLLNTIKNYFSSIFNTNSENNNNNNNNNNNHDNGVYSFDRYWPSEDNLLKARQEQEPIIFYMQIGSIDYSLWVNFIQSISSVSPIVVRNNPLIVGEKFSLSNWGASLKPFGYSMEYGIKDEPSDPNQSKNSNKEKEEEEEEKIPSEIQLPSIKYFVDLEKKAFSTFSGMKKEKEETKEKEKEKKRKRKEKEKFYNLGYKAVEWLTNQENPLKALTFLTQNFPIFVDKIADIEPSEKTRKAINSHRSELDLSSSPQQNFYFLNGRKLTEEDLEPFNIQNVMHQEVKKNQFDPGFLPSISSQDAIKLSKIPGSDQVTPRINLDSEFTIYLNDLEKDPEYQNWRTKSVRDMLQPNRQGSIYWISKNIYNVIAIVDLTISQGLQIVNEFASMAGRAVPIHFGLLFKENEKNPQLSQQISKIFYYLQENFEKQKKYDFFLYLNEELLINNQQEINFKMINNAYNRLKIPNVLIENLISSDKYEPAIKSMNEFLKSKNLNSSPIYTVNGKVFNLNAINRLSSHLLWETNDLRELVRKNLINDDSNLNTQIISQYNNFDHWDSEIFSNEPIYYFNTVNYFELNDNVQFFMNSGAYNSNLDLKSNLDSDLNLGITHILMININNENKIKTMEWLNDLKKSIDEKIIKTRIGIIYNLNEDYDYNEINEINKEIFGKEILKDVLHFQHNLVKNILRFKPTQSGIITNGGFREIKDLTAMNKERFSIINYLEKENKLKQINKHIKELDNNLSLHKEKFYEFYSLFSIFMSIEHQYGIHRNEKFQITNKINNNLQNNEGGHILKNSKKMI